MTDLINNPYFLLVLGLVVLIFSGEFLVKGAVRIATVFRISPLVIGMTIVSFGTSAPELLVSLQAALSGHPGIAIGNVIGSNIANLGLVMGMTALVFPIAVDKNSLRIDWPMMMLASLAFYFMGLNLELGFWEGAILFGSLLGFNFWLIRQSRKKSAPAAVSEEQPLNLRHILQNVGLIAIGCLGLVFGADWLVDGAASIAHQFGVSDHVIGVTVIAFGTSVPELITSVVAALRKQTDISVGNLIGSNLFNIMAILGITSMVTPIAIEETVMNFDIYWMLGVALIVFPLMFLGRKISRVEGGILLLIYCTYIFFQL